jgi:flagellar motor switch protein FliG
MSEAAPLAGVEKAAALLLAMGKPLASRLLAHFDEAELRRLAQAAAGLRALPAPQVEALVDDFADRFSAGAEVVGDIDRARGLIEGALPGDVVADIMADVAGQPKQSFWTRAAALPDRRLAQLMSVEHPQIAAFLLDRLDASRVAAVLVLLPPRRRDAAAERLVGLRRLPDPALRVVETALERDLFGADADAAPEKPEARLVEIAARLERDQVEEIIAALETTRPDAARKLRESLFAFDDVALLSERERMTLFDRASTEQVIAALKGTSDAFRDAVLSAMAARSRRMVEAELRNADQIADKDVAAARAAIERIVVQMIAEGLAQRPDPQAAA